MNEQDMMRENAWVSFVASQLGFAHHPGTTRDNARPRCLEQICTEADAYLREFDKRFRPELRHRKEVNGHAAVSQ